MAASKPKTLAHPRAAKSVARLPPPAPTSSSTAKPNRWNDVLSSHEPVHALKRRALIQEASRAFGRSGYLDTSLEDIANRLNLSKASLYYYVKSKDELLFECYQIVLDLGDQAIGRAISEGSTGFDQIRIFMTCYIELLTTELDAAAVLFDYSYLQADMRGKIQLRRRQHDQVLRRMIRMGIEDGSVRDCDPKLAVLWFMGAVNSIARWYDKDGPLDGAAIAAAYTDFAMKGFGKVAAG